MSNELRPQTIRLNTKLFELKLNEPISRLYI